MKVDHEMSLLGMIGVNGCVRNKPRLRKPPYGLVAFARCAARSLYCAMRCAVVARDAMRGLVAFARCSCKRRQRHAFDGGILRVVFFGISSTLIDDHTLPGQTEGLKVGCGGMGGQVGGWDGMGLGMGGGMGLRVGFININDMYNNDVGQGVVYAYEAYEAK